METAAFMVARFALIGPAEALAWIDGAARGERFAYVVTPNVDHLVMLGEDGPEPSRARYRAAVAGADLCVNDSRIVQRLARLSNVALPVTPGSDIVRALVDARRGGSGDVIALIGGRAAEADWLTAALRGHRIIHHEPPMGVRDSAAAQDAIADFVETARADIVLFAIGAPQSEIVCEAIARRGRARGVALCIGASVEFLSGAKQRAPRWMQRAGLEWLFRLASEPGRLWHRYLVRGPRIFAMWWAARRAGSSLPDT